MTIGVFFSQHPKIIVQQENLITFDVQFDAPSFNVKSYLGKSYLDFTQNKEITTFQKGAPALPFFTQSILLPPTGNSHLKVTYDEVIEYQNIQILPSFGIQKRKELNPIYQFGEVYTKNEFYPGKLASTSPPYLLRELRGQTIQLYPYQYNPISKTLRFYKNLRITVSFDQTPGVNELIEQPESSLGTQLFKDNFLNSSIRNEKYIAKTEVGEMLVICPESYKTTVQPLIDWKNQKGIKTKVETIETIGKDAASIKKFVQDYYTSNPSFLYLLLVGDAEDLPSYTYGNYSNDEYWSDSYFGQLSGNDYYSELFVGRFSGTISDVQTMVNRTLEYEKNPATGDWMSRAIGIASNQGAGIGDNGETDFAHSRLIRSNLLASDYTYVYEFYDGNQGGQDADNNPSANDIITAINEGVGLINYTGHGDTDNFVTGSFYSSDVLSANNVGKYPFIVSVACNNGKFVAGTCLAETWLRAKKNTSITGAIGMCGSSILMDWAPPMKTQDEIVSLLSNASVFSRKTTLGAIFNNGQFSMLEKYGTEGEGVVQTWVFFGDPSTVLRNRVTKSMDVAVEACPECSYAEKINFNALSGASVGVSKNNLFLQLGEVKDNFFTYTFPITEQREKYTFTFTKQNYGIRQIEVESDGKSSISVLNSSPISIYPIPAKDKIYIVGLTTTPKTFTLVDQTGRVIQTIVGTNEVDIQALDRGVYFLTGETTGSLKFVKE